VNGSAVRTGARRPSPDHASYALGIGHDVRPAALQGLVRFGIERLDPAEGEHRRLANHIRLSGRDRPGHTNSNPLQTFLGGDSTAKPAHNYTYRVHALDGTPGTELNTPRRRHPVRSYGPSTELRRVV
jgi:hypothetical protein